MTNGDDDEFYMILPSNGCKDTHPENEANKYFISWEQPIELNAAGWKVALTEANFSYTMSSINTSFGIRYDWWKTTRKQYKGKIVCDESLKNVEFRFDGKLPDDPPADSNGQLKPFTIPKIWYDGYQLLVIEASMNFTFLDMGSGEIRNCNGFDPYRVYIDAEKFKGGESDIVIEFMTFPYRVTNEIFAKEDVFWSDKKQMGEGVSKIFSDVFADAHVDEETKKLNVKLQKNIASVEFISGLNIVLGFAKRRYDDFSNSTNIIAENEPFLRHGINAMYVYSSICQPIRVGDICAPLLKSIWLDSGKIQTHVFGETCNVVVKNPMYLPLSSTSINVIEVNIRSDSGHLIPFVAGSVTSLTLHFKKNKKH